MLGRTGGDNLVIKASDEEIINLKVCEIEEAWRGSLGGKLQAEVMVAGAE